MNRDDIEQEHNLRAREFADAQVELDGAKNICEWHSLNPDSTDRDRQDSAYKLYLARIARESCKWRYLDCVAKAKKEGF